ncbi:MAG: porin family protein, partial [Xanthobacteraceae bacterium]|nr:porin family protein [Xanthobacteraceae bacterium]
MRFHRVLIAAGLLASVALPAAAADLPARAPAYAPVVAPITSWTGFYIGGNAGYGWGDQDVTLSGAGTSGSIGASASG